MAAELILGGARSGKSALAERRALESGLEVLYLATAQAGDGEMGRRIAQHQQRRPSHWGLCEEPLQLAHTLQHHAHAGRLILVDCLTLWLSNLMFSDPACARFEETGLLPGDFARLHQEIDALLAVLPQLPGRIVFVSNEVGWGIVPMGALTRFWMDEAGRLNQKVAALCQRVTLVAAGLPLEMKG